MSNPQSQNELVLSLKTTHQMDDSAIKNLSESDIVMPRTQEEFFRDLVVKSGILRFFLSDNILWRNINDKMYKKKTRNPSHHRLPGLQQNTLQNK